MFSTIFETLINYYLENPIAQSIGLLALAIILYGLGQKNDVRLRNISWIGTLFMWIHFLFLWFYIAAFLCLVAMTRNITSAYFAKNNKVIALISVVYILLFFVTFESWYDILLILSALIVNFAYFKSSGIMLKAIILWNSLIWLIFNFHSQSIGGMITSASIILVLMVPIFSFMLSKSYYKNKLIPIPLENK